MDRSNSIILKINEKVRQHNSKGYWELLLAAANDEQAIKNLKAGLDVNELKKGSLSELTVAPSIIEMRIEALSVSQIDFLKGLWQEVKSFDNINPFIAVTKDTLKKYFDPNENYLSKNNDIDILTTDDLLEISRNNTDLLMALRSLDIDFYQVDFSYWIKNIETIDPWVLAIIIELSQKANVPHEDWINAFIVYFDTVEDPRDVIPSAYILISPEWSVR